MKTLGIILIAILIFYGAKTLLSFCALDEFSKGYITAIMVTAFLSIAFDDNKIKE